ncbi:MAG: beta-galactosidase, partial [Armatimonadetes bacterium]|nr:beta-galactosidase [Armatimonadota bacterium]
MKSWKCFSIRLLAPALLLLGGSRVAAEETEVLFDGSTIADWDTSRDQSRLEREFSLSELKKTSNPDALRWRFVPRGVTFNDIFLHRRIARPYSVLRVHVKNDGEAITVACKAGDAESAEWTANTVHLAKGSDWQWVEFPWREWKVASWSRDPDGKMDFPLTYFTLIAFDVKAGLGYGLRVARVEVVRPDPPVATIHDFLMPDRLRHGQSFRGSLSFTLDKPCMVDGASLVFRNGKTERFRELIPLPTPLTRAQPGRQVTVGSFAVKVPEYVVGGRQSVAIELGEARVLWKGRRADEEAKSVNIEARKPGRTTATVKVHKGAPTLFINGHPHNGMAYAAYGPSVEVFTDFAKAGVDLFTFAATPTESGYGLSKTAWLGPDQYDFSELDHRVQMVLQANPNAWFFPRLYVHAPKWWSDQHPDDLVLMDPGDGKPVPFMHAGGKPAPSWASEQWRKDTVEGLKRLIAHVQASPYADRCIGYHIASGTTEEWMMWGGNEDEWVDYSPVNTARFRDWLRDKYRTEDRLREAWKDPSVAFETAAIPTKAQRQKSEIGSLRDPTREQAVIDYYLYNSDLVADTICYFARAVKAITKREKIVGVFYGYLLQLCGEQRQQNGGHLALEKVLASPDVDFLCSPTSYAFRQLGGEGTSHFMSLLGSIEAHNKLWFDENDVRTSLSGGQVGEWGRPANLEGDLLQQNKELANCFVNGAAQWWFDVGGNKYNDPVLMKGIEQLTTLASTVALLVKTPADEIAMVVDERSLCYLRVADPLGNWLLVGQLPALHRIGAPVGHYLVTDLPRLKDRKVFLFMTSFAPTAADRAAIDSLKRDGHVLVFFYAPGLYRDGRLDESAMTELTGIRLR